MGSIIDKITEFIKEMLQGWVLDNLETMFTDVNTKVGTIAGEVGQTPSSWNAGVFSMIDNLSDTVMVPIAGMIISAILCYELITMVMDKNNMHEMGSEFFFRYLVKACIAVLLVSYTSDIKLIEEDKYLSTEGKEAYAQYRVEQEQKALEQAQAKMEHETKVACKNAIEKAIAEKFDGYRLPKDIAEAVIQEYGSERVSYVLANSVMHKKAGRTVFSGE